MPHQSDCHRLIVVSYSSDSSGDRVGPLVCVLYRQQGDSTIVSQDMAYRNDSLRRLRWDGPRLLLKMFSLDHSFQRDRNRRNRSRGNGHTAPIV